MIHNFLNKRKKNKEKKELITLLINNLNISEEQKSLYLSSIDILNENEIEVFYKEMSIFIENIEIKEIEDIRANSFSNIVGIKKKEAEEKKKDLNSFNFLLHNL